MSTANAVSFPAPENENGTNFNEFTDVYSLGACLWELALPVDEDADEEAEEESPLDPDLEDLFADLVEDDPDDRPTPRRAAQKFKSIAFDPECLPKMVEEMEAKIVVRNAVRAQNAETQEIMNEIMKEIESGVSLKPVDRTQLERAPPELTLHDKLIRDITNFDKPLESVIPFAGRSVDELLR